MGTNKNLGKLKLVDQHAELGGWQTNANRVE